MDKDYGRAIRVAFRVEFLETNQEVLSYARAIYGAMKWGKKIDEANRVMREKSPSSYLDEVQSDGSPNLNYTSK